MKIRRFHAPCPYGRMKFTDLRTQAVNAKAQATAVYNTANDNLIDDVARYNDDNNTWDRVGPNMPEPDKTNCYNEMNDAYNALCLEDTYVQTAFDWLGVAQEDIAEGDAATTEAAKNAHYQDSIQASGSATDVCNTNAAPNHATVVTKLTAAENILVLYG